MLVFTKQVPLGQIPVLKDSSPIKVMLAHSAAKWMNWSGGHCVRLVQLPESHVEGFLVSVKVLIKKIRLFVVPHRQAQRVPALLFVHHDLAAFKFWFIAIDNTTATARTPALMRLPPLREIPAVVGMNRELLASRTDGPSQTDRP